MTKSKKSAYLKQAEELYVTQNQTLESIAKELPISLRSLQTWKSENNWESKRAEYTKNKQDFRSELLRYATLLIRRVNEKLENGEQVPASELNAVARIAPELLEESVVNSIQKDQPEKKHNTKDIVDIVDKALKGEV